MAGFLFVGQTRPPLALVIVHGVAAVVAVALVLLGTLTQGVTPSLAFAIVALACAVAAGFRLLALHARHRPLLPTAVGVHALLALGGFLVMVVGFLQ